MSLIPKQTGYFKSFDGTRIYYEIRGRGQPLILNYGIGCLINHWRHQIKHFSQTHSVIVYDYRAHHRSEIPENHENLTVDALAEDLNGLMHHLEIPTASLWAHSFGAQVLLRFYELYPDHAANLVLINGFAQNPLKGMFGTDLTQSMFQWFKSGYQVLPETLSFLWKVGIQNPLAVQLSALAGGFNLQLTSLKDVEIYARGMASMDINAFLRLFESMIHYDGRPGLQKIRVPTILIGGMKDTVTPPRYQEEMQSHIKGSELYLVPYGTHCSQLDMPDLVNLKIEKFLTKAYANEPRE